MKLPINYYACSGQGTGYGGSSEHIMTQMEKSELFDVNLISIKSRVKQMFLKESESVRNKPIKITDIGYCYGLPHMFSLMFRVPHKFKVGFTMFETDKLPEGRNDYNGITGRASDVINKLDLLIVPCEHNVQVFRNAGVTIPIEVVPLAVDAKLFKDMTWYRQIRRKKDDTVTFLMSGQLTTRKNTGVAIAAFMKAFGTKEDQLKSGKKAQLVLKTMSGTHHHMSWPMHNIKIIDKTVSPEEMLKIYGDADFFVFPSRGEGFGLTPLEAMATGMFAVFPDHTGMKNYANEELCGVLHNYKKDPAIQYPFEYKNVGNWFECDYNELADWMTHCYDEKEKYFEIGEKAVSYANTFTYEKTVKMIHEAILKYYGR